MSIEELFKDVEQCRIDSASRLLRMLGITGLMALFLPVALVGLFFTQLYGFFQAIAYGGLLFGNAAIRLLQVNWEEKCEG